MSSIRTRIDISSLTIGTLLLIRANLKARIHRIQLALGAFSGDVYEKRGRRRSHLIAHSFGTKLATLDITETGNNRYERIILAGAVLPRTFPWNKHSPDLLRHVRNDTGSRDLVGWLIFLFRPLVTDLGTSGLWGFKDSEFAHTLAHKWAACQPCNTAPAIVHNAPSGFFHSGALKRPNVEQFWLPFLLNIGASEYALFLDLCAELADLQFPANNTESQQRSQERLRREREFLDYPWSWAKSQMPKFDEPIIDYLARLIASRLRSRRIDVSLEVFLQLAYLAAGRMCLLVVDGEKAQNEIFAIVQTANDPIEEVRMELFIPDPLRARAQMTDPRHAAQAAASWVVDFYSGGGGWAPQRPANKPPNRRH